MIVPLCSFPLTIHSRGPSLRLSLRLPDAAAATANYFKSEFPLFSADFSFVHPSKWCGPAALVSSKTSGPGAGSLTFPAGGPPVTTYENLTCIWDLTVSRSQSSLHFTMANFTFRTDAEGDDEEDCQSARLQILLPDSRGRREEVFYQRCAGGSGSKRAKRRIPVLRAKRLSPSRLVRIRLWVEGGEHMRSGGAFHLRWSRE